MCKVVIVITEIKICFLKNLSFIGLTWRYFSDLQIRKRWPKSLFRGETKKLTVLQNQMVIPKQCGTAIPLPSV